MFLSYTAIFPFYVHSRLPLSASVSSPVHLIDIPNNLQTGQSFDRQSGNQSFGFIADLLCNCGCHKSPFNPLQELFIYTSSWSAQGFSFAAQQIHRIIDYPKLEGAHKDHQVQLLALHSTIPRSHHIPERIVQMLLEFCQAWCCDPFPGDPVPMPKHPLGFWPIDGDCGLVLASHHHCPTKNYVYFD